MTRVFASAVVALLAPDVAAPPQSPQSPAGQDRIDGCSCSTGEWIEMTFAEPSTVSQVEIYCSTPLTPPHRT